MMTLVQAWDSNPGFKLTVEDRQPSAAQKNNLDETFGDNCTCGPVDAYIPDKGVKHQRAMQDVLQM